jgi:diaminobutyrate-2-oxoglutarate transaminase
MLSSLKELETASRMVGEVRGKGLMLGVEFVRDKATKEAWPEGAQGVRSACHRKGLLIEIGGHYNNVARFLPPLVLTDELAEKGLAIFMDSVQEVERSL